MVQKGFKPILIGHQHKNVWLISLAKKWNEIVLIGCVMSVALDPLFFYIPVIDEQRQCLDLDNKLKICACFFRTLIDLIRVIHIIRMFSTGRFSSSRYRVVIDVLAVLPLPQLVVLLAAPRYTKQLIKIVIITQYIPRLIRISPVYKEAINTSHIINTQTAWAGAAFNLLLYFIASHVVGAFWYIFSIDREDRCWRNECGKFGPNNYKPEYLYCRGSSNIGQNITFSTCIVKNPDDIDDQNRFFNYGIFYPALSDVATSTDFPFKLLYCFWWGLRSLSSLGQNLQTSPYFGEILFSVFICVFGLILFALLIGNMQTSSLVYKKCLETMTIRVEEMKAKRQHVEQTEQWMAQWSVGENLRAKIRKYEHYKWKETRGIDVDTLIHNLPKDLRKEVKGHLCLDLLLRVPVFYSLDAQLLDAICVRLKPMIYTENTSIMIEGHPVEEMIFIRKGSLLCMREKYNTFHLHEGDFCGEELVTWALSRRSSSSNLPISTWTVKTTSDVQAFALLADDLRVVSMHFFNQNPSKKKEIMVVSRFYSLEWRIWGSRYIQAAWRLHCRRKLEKAQRDTEDRLQNALANEGSSVLSLGTTIYASRFATKLLMSARRRRSSGFTNTSMQFQLQKPADPDII